MKKEILSRNMVLETLRSAFEKSYTTGDMLDTKLQNLLNFCSVIVSVVASIEVATFQNKVGIVFWVLLLIALVLYFVSFVVIVRGLNPAKYVFPISNNWAELSKRYFHTDEKDLLELMISEYLTSMEETRESNEPKVKAVKMASFFMVLIVLLLLLAVPLGLLFPAPTLSDLSQFIANFVSLIVSAPIQVINFIRSLIP